MDIPVVEVMVSRSGNIKAKLLMTHSDALELKFGEYALIKIDSLNDRIAVEELIEQLKNK